MIVLLLIPMCILITLVALPFSKGAGKGRIAAACIIINALITGYFAIQVLQPGLLDGILYGTFYGGIVFGDITLKMDSLSAWFILLMNFTAITSVLYGNQYLKVYRERTAHINLHYISLVLIQGAMIGIYLFQHTLAFMCAWELMAVSAFLLVIFESSRMETLKAGMNYLIQSHVSVVFLLIGFLWVFIKTGSFDFNALSDYTIHLNPAISFVLFFTFFLGFSIKAGFVPFHTWLPYAHPAAPSHVSGLMSGVLIKLGIYGILRMLLLIRVDYVLVGTIILVLSVISGLYGVMLAIMQHNLKKLLAYHSIENIGIIGMGIGLGSIGHGIGNNWLEFAGFAGALLHTLNHSLFKSLLFYAAGTVYRSTHRIHIERLGGLIHKLPQTSLLFLLASLAICGLPPFNGFISEFLIYSGFFNALHTNQISFLVIIILSIFSLVLIGGLALLCFTKAFGIAFLGMARSEYPVKMDEEYPEILFPKYLIALFIFAVGLFPGFFMQVVAAPVSLFHKGVLLKEYVGITSTMQQVGYASWGFIALIALLFYIRRMMTREQVITRGPTWGCGYTVPSARLQYTSSSFARSYKHLIKPMLRITRHERRPDTIVPGRAFFESHVHDKIEHALLDVPLRHMRAFIGRFKFLQNGSVQFYILYGVVFILIAITIPFLIHATRFLIDIFKQL